MAIVPAMQAEDLSLHLQDPCKKLGMVPHVCSSSTGGEDTKGSLKLAGHSV